MALALRILKRLSQICCAGLGLVLIPYSLFFIARTTHPRSLLLGDGLEAQVYTTGGELGSAFMLAGCLGVGVGVLGVGAWFHDRLLGLMVLPVFLFLYGAESQGLANGTQWRSAESLPRVAQQYLYVRGAGDPPSSSLSRSWYQHSDDIAPRVFLSCGAGSGGRADLGTTYEVVGEVLPQPRGAVTIRLERSSCRGEIDALFGFSDERPGPTSLDPVQVPHEQISNRFRKIAWDLYFQREEELPERWSPFAPEPPRAIEK